MMKLIGIPKAKAPKNLACSKKFIVPNPCQKCRQIGRWATKTKSWAKKKNSRFKAIITAILKSHDDILSSFCGLCFVQETRTCDCDVAFYKSLGLTLKIPILTGWDDCLNAGRKIKIKSCGDDECWFLSCKRQICETCSFIELSPCESPDHLDVFNRLLLLENLRLQNRPTGPAVIASLEALFTGSSPRIIKTEFGRVWATIGRDMTPLEIQFREFFNSRIPLSDGVELILVQPCQ